MPKPQCTQNSSVKNTKRLLLAFIVASSFFLSESAQAISRTVYFTQSGRNVTTLGLGETARGSCRITISNPSSQSQTYSLTVTANATNSAAGAATLTANDAACASLGGGRFTCETHTLTNGQSHSYTFSFPVYPVRATIAAGQQVTTCSGSITANDVGNPGFLLGSGSLLTFTESGAIQTQNATGGMDQFGGQALYTQLPLVINRGKPF